MPSSTPSIDIGCYTRACTVVEPVDTVVQTLRTYDDRDIVDTVQIETWPDEVPLADDQTAQSIVEQYDRFTTWADREGVSLEPAFETRDRTTLVSETAETVLRLPVVCLAIHLDDELSSVVPHRTSTTTYTVEEALADIEQVAPKDLSLADRGHDAGQVPETLTTTIDRREADPPTAHSTGQTPTTCPDCGDALARGQGVYACPSCAWSEALRHSDDPEYSHELPPQDRRETSSPEGSNRRTPDWRLPPPSS